MNVEIPMKGKIGSGYTFHRLGINEYLSEGEEITVDISSQEFRRQWWKVEFEGCYFTQNGNELVLVEVPVAEVVEEKVKSKPKASAKAEAV